ncbi:putative major sperm protein 2 [Trichinella spiralis]|uniref:putative major sperm protein 2 n=1 Tax=Trichinella spiralis TaxID=6334 RepID=UPI0001EFC534|nr:putative major sperm protein 2 [Trichinella spiralis]
MTTNKKVAYSLIFDELAIMKKDSENVNEAEEKKSSAFVLVDEEDVGEQPARCKKFLLQPCSRISFNAPFAFTQKTHIRIVNTSDAPFAWMLSKNVSSVIFISPQNGCLQPNESVIVDVEMNPFKGKLKETDKFALPIPLAIYHALPTEPVDGELDYFWKAISYRSK